MENISIPAKRTTPGTSLDKVAGNEKSIVANRIYDPENENVLPAGEEYHEDFETLRLNLVRKDST